jgi:hypothetical protein
MDRLRDLMALPALLENAFAKGYVVDVALLVIALEFVVLALRAKPDVRSARILTLVHALGPGVCLMLALRCALVGADVLWVAFWLAASLPLHLWDVASRKL